MSDIVRNTIQTIELRWEKTNPDVHKDIRTLTALIRMLLSNNERLRRAVGILADSVDPSDEVIAKMTGLDLAELQLLRAERQSTDTTEL